MKKLNKHKMFTKEQIVTLWESTPSELRSERLIQIIWAFKITNSNSLEFYLGHESLSWNMPHPKAHGNVQITMMAYTNHRVFTAYYVDKDTHQMTYHTVNITSDHAEKFATWLAAF